MVNNRLVSFDNVFKMVMNSSLNVILPPNFINPPPKNPLPKLNPTPGYGSKQKGKGKKRKSNKAKGERITKNAAPIPKFLMKEGKNWNYNFAGKCLMDRPKWDNTTFMSTRWYIHAKCFVDCNNKASCVGKYASPQGKHSRFKKYLEKVCREHTPSPWV